MTCRNGHSPPTNGPRRGDGHQRVEVDIDLAACRILGGQSMDATAAMTGASRRTLGRRFEEGPCALRDGGEVRPADVHPAVVAPLGPMPPSADELEPGDPPPWWAEDDSEPPPDLDIDPVEDASE